MAISSVSDLPVEGRRVFVRVDFNTPLTKGDERKVANDARIQAALPTIRHLLSRDARVILASHLGRPKGKKVPELSLEPVAKHLASLLDAEVLLTDEPAGDGARKVVGDLRAGHVMMLENLRFDPGEEANDPRFAEALASYADVYVNDAFGAAHRAHASTQGMVHHVSERGTGLLMEKEVKALSRLLGEVERPYLALLGGAKVSGKIDVLESLLSRVNVILIGGAMANTFLRANGLPVGKSLIEEEKLPLARSFLRKARDAGVTIVLPVDGIVAHGLDDTEGRVCASTDTPVDQMILDIGPKSITAFREHLAEARTIFWNGPMGVFEKPPFAQGTLSVAHAVAEADLAFRVVGGGDSVAAVAAAGVFDAIDHVSTGGGASLEFVQGLELPGITALEA